MPRINFIPPPINFNDRGTALVNPIMSNAMQLAETFTTEIPRLRMQQEAIDKEDSRYGAERDYRKKRDTVADLASRWKAYSELMQPDGVDLNRDGIGDLMMSAGRGKSGGVSAPRSSGTADYAKEADAYAASMTKPLVRTGVQIRKPDGTPLLDSSGNYSYRDEQESKDELNARLRAAIMTLHKIGTPAARAQARALYARGVDPFPILQAGGAENTGEDLSSSMRNWALTDDAVDADPGSQASPSGPVSMGGTPVQSATRRSLAQQNLIQMKNMLQSMPPGSMDGSGFTVAQIDEALLALEGQAQGAQQGPPGAEEPSAGVVDQQMNAQFYSPEGPAAPEMRIEDPVQSPVAPSPTTPYAGFERTPTADNLVATKEASANALAALAQEASADPERDPISFDINANDPTGFSDRRQPLDLQAGLDGMQMLSNPNGIPDWLLPFLGRKASTVPKRVAPATLQMLQGGQVDPTTGVVRFRPQSLR